MHKVLIIVGDATETVDTLYPYYRLIEAGMQPVVAAPEKRRYQMVLHEVKPGWTITKEWEGYSIEADVAFAEVDPNDYLGIFFSGGRAPEYIRYDADLVLVDLNKTATIRNEQQETKSRWSPWHSVTLTGWPVRTWVLGQEVFREGHINPALRGHEAAFDHTRGGYWAT